MRYMYNHLSGITIRHYGALDFCAKSYIGQGCAIHYHSVCIWLFIFCICTLFKNVMQLCLFVIRMEDSFDFHVGKRVASHLLALT